ncbi:MAG TPA: response regulator [Vicinamibacterales bacterium]|nr:response regulator [Vicinamibacterales bacterium]
MADVPRPLVLIVEDDPGVAVLQKRRLERAEFRVATAADVDAAMNALEAGGVHLVLLDYRLGSTTGLHLHRRMRAAGFEVPVIMVTGSVDDTIVLEAMRAGVRDVVVKSTDYLEHLPETVRRVLAQAQATPDVLPHDPAVRVLLVEDDPGAATLQRRYLERAGYEVEVATRPDDALRAARSGRVGVAVLDLRLEGEASGLDLYEQMRREGAAVPALLVTAYPDEAVAIRALRTGIRDFIPKTGDYLDHLPLAVDRIVAQIRVERKLLESELRIASIIATTMDAIVMCDADHRIVLFNRSAEDMFGCPAAEALGQPLERFIPDLRLGEAAARAAGGGIRQRIETDAARTDGGRLPIEVSLSEVLVHGRRLFTVIARDISERRRIEAELREADRRKDEFLGMLAHELRNPLAAVMNAGELLHRMIPEGPALKAAAVVRRQAKTLARMVDDLLDVSRVTLGKIQLAKEPVLLADVLARSVENVRDAAARASLSLELRIDGEPVPLLGDSTRLEQVFVNLLTNAIKFTPPGGRITLEAEREQGEAVVRVRDTGIGIDAGILPRIFDLFVQGDTSLDRSRSGLGIGLSLVRQIVTLHGGQVTAASDGPGRGAEFVVRLPVSRHVPAPGASAASAEPLTDRLRILVVDDQPDVADSVAGLLQALGHESHSLYDGRAAIDMARTYLPDVMIVDIGMPVTSGYDVAREVRREQTLAGTALIALTGYGREEDRAQVLDAGFDVHLVKPLGEPKLRDVLASLAGRKGASQDD